MLLIWWWWMLLIQIDVNFCCTCSRMFIIRFTTSFTIIFIAIFFILFHYHFKIIRIMFLLMRPLYVLHLFIILKWIDFVTVIQPPHLYMFSNVVNMHQSSPKTWRDQKKFSTWRRSHLMDCFCSETISGSVVLIVYTPKWLTFSRILFNFIAIFITRW